MEEKEEHAAFCKATGLPIGENVLSEIYSAAGLTADDIKRMPAFIEGEGEFYGSEAYDKLYEYFAFESCEMPYEAAKARSVCPDEWILDYLEARS